MYIYTQCHQLANVVAHFHQEVYQTMKLCPFCNWTKYSTAARLHLVTIININIDTSASCFNAWLSSAECGIYATGILRNNSALIFRKIPVVKIPHSAFYPYPWSARRSYYHLLSLTNRNVVVVVEKQKTSHNCLQMRRIDGELNQSIPYNIYSSNNSQIGGTCR